MKLTLIALLIATLSLFSCTSEDSDKLVLSHIRDEGYNGFNHFVQDVVFKSICHEEKVSYYSMTGFWPSQDFPETEGWLLTIHLYLGQQGKGHFMALSGAAIVTDDGIEELRDPENSVFISKEVDWDQTDMGLILEDRLDGGRFHITNQDFSNDGARKKLIGESEGLLDEFSHHPIPLWNIELTGEAVTTSFFSDNSGEVIPFNVCESE